MKYTKGTPTLLGKIEEVDTSCTSMPYLVNRIIAVGYWFTESEIDAIVINPKRNIDHLIELWDGGKEYESASFMADFVNGNGSTTKMMQTLMKPYTEPRICHIVHGPIRLYLLIALIRKWYGLIVRYVWCSRYHHAYTRI